MTSNRIRTKGIRLGVWLALWSALAAVEAKSASIGPDSFGYMANDATPYSFVDISSTGASVLAGADDDKALLNLGFTFVFYGSEYASVCVSSNGLLTFGGCNSDFANQDLTGTAPTGDYPTIAPFWSDLSFAVSGAGAVYYQTLGQPGDRQFVVQWQNAYPLNGSKGVTFQAILYEAGGRIVFQYLDVNTGAGSQTSNGGSATVGIRDSNSLTNGRALQWSFKAPVLHNGQAILYVSGDTVPPIVTFSGNDGTYTVDQTINITCSASDDSSGIASIICPNMIGPAWSFPLDKNTFTATATDKAGNVGTGTTSFIVQVTFASLCSLTRQFCTKTGVADNLCADLDAAAKAAARGNTKAQAGAIKSYINDVKAQSGKSLKADQAKVLIGLAGAL